MPIARKMFDAEQMRLMLRGTYNKIPSNARRSVVSRFEVLKEKSDATCSLDDERILVEFAPTGPNEDGVDLPLQTADRQRLSENDEELLRMRMEGLTQKEIARRLGKSQPAVSQQLARIREKLGT